MKNCETKFLKNLHNVLINYAYTCTYHNRNGCLFQKKVVQTDQQRKADAENLEKGTVLLSFSSTYFIKKKVVFLAN